jgi:2,5-furandicarboxylate decarboxylase 1
VWTTGDILGGFYGEPVKLVKCETSDLTVPINAEIVIEGFIDPEGEEKDGTLGESSGYYMSFSKSPTIQVNAITFRKGAIYHSIIPWSLEVDNLLYLVHGVDFVPKMKRNSLP